MREGSAFMQVMVNCVEDVDLGCEISQSIFTNDTQASWCRTAIS